MNPIIYAIIGSNKKTFKQNAGEKNYILIIGPNVPKKVATNPFINIVQKASFASSHPKSPCDGVKSSLAPSYITAIMHITAIIKILRAMKCYTTLSFMSNLLNIKKAAVMILLNTNIMSTQTTDFLYSFPFLLVS